MTVHVHVHKRVKDEARKWRVEWRTLATGSKPVGEAQTEIVEAADYAEAKRKILSKTGLPREILSLVLQDNVKDLALNKSGEPSTDAERRNCICEVAKLGDCTRGTAEQYLKLNDWNIQSAVRDLERDRKQGFVVDSVRDGVVQYVRDAEAIRVKKAEFEKAVVGQTMTINGRTAKVKAKHSNGGILGLEVEWQQGATSAYENWKKGEVELEKARQQGSGSQYFRSK